MVVPRTTFHTLRGTRFPNRPQQSRPWSGGVISVHQKLCTLCDSLTDPARSFAAIICTALAHRVDRSVGWRPVQWPIVTAHFANLRNQLATRAKRLQSSLPSRVCVCVCAEANWLWAERTVHFPSARGPAVSSVMHFNWLRHSGFDWPAEKRVKWVFAGGRGGEQTAHSFFCRAPPRSAVQT